MRKASSRSSRVSDGPNELPEWYYMVRVHTQPSWTFVCIRIAFLGGTPGAVRHRIVSEFRAGIAALTFEAVPSQSHLAQPQQTQQTQQPQQTQLAPAVAVAARSNTRAALVSALSGHSASAPASASAGQMSIPRKEILCCSQTQSDWGEHFVAVTLSNKLYDFEHRYSLTIIQYDHRLQIAKLHENLSMNDILNYSHQQHRLQAPKEIPVSDGHTRYSLIEPPILMLFHHFYHQRIVYKDLKSDPSILEKTLNLATGLLLRLRLSEGFRFAYSSQGFVTLLIELNMSLTSCSPSVSRKGSQGSQASHESDEDNSRRAALASSCSPEGPEVPEGHATCCMQYVAFLLRTPRASRVSRASRASHSGRSSRACKTNGLLQSRQCGQSGSPTGRTGVQCESQSSESSDTQSERVSLVLEYWIEPQVGCVMGRGHTGHPADQVLGAQGSLGSQVPHTLGESWRNRLYNEMVQLLAAADHDVLLAFYTFEYLRVLATSGTSQLLFSHFQLSFSNSSLCSIPLFQYWFAPCFIMHALLILLIFLAIVIILSFKLGII